MIEPPPASTRCGIANLQPRYAPLRLTAMIRSQTSSSRSGAGPSAGSQTPALLYRTCSAPNVRTADLHGGLHLRGAGDVDHRTDRRPAGGAYTGHGGVDRRRVAVAGHDVCALGGEQLRGAPAHAAAGAGDQRGSAFQPNAGSGRVRHQPAPCRSAALRRAVSVSSTTGSPSGPVRTATRYSCAATSADTNPSRTSASTSSTARSVGSP